MEISDDIKVKKAVRMGKGPHHSLKIELGNPDDKSVVFANASNLKFWVGEIFLSTPEHP